MPNISTDDRTLVTAARRPVATCPPGYSVSVGKGGTFLPYRGDQSWGWCGGVHQSRESAVGEAWDHYDRQVTPVDRRTGMVEIDGVWQCRAPGEFARRLTRKGAASWLAKRGLNPDGTPIATPADTEAAAKVMAYADRHVANRGLKPTFPALWPCDRTVLDAWPVVDVNHPNPTIKTEIAHFTTRALAMAAVAAAEAKHADVITAQRGRGE
jgi:hypothetical protein